MARWRGRVPRVELPEDITTTITTTNLASSIGGLPFHLLFAIVDSAIYAMASFLRPTVMRPGVFATSTARFVSAKQSPATSVAFSTLHISKSSQPSPRLVKAAFVRDALPGSLRVAAFHATARRDILPPLPQRINGTANEAAPVPEPHATHGAYHWTFERAVSVALIPITIAPFAGGSLNPVMDATLCALLLAHSHVGFQSCIIDYFPKKRVPKTRTFLEWTLRFATLAAAIGLYEFETNDVGVTEAVRRIWTAPA